MLKNTKLLGTVLLLTVACGKSDNNKPNGLGGVEITIDNPLPVNVQNSEETIKVVEGSLSKGIFLDSCGENGVSCDGLWVLKQARCNNEVISESFAGEAVALNIKGTQSQLQFDTALIEPALFSTELDGNNTSLVFTINEGTVLRREYLLDNTEGMMKVYLPKSEVGVCARGERMMLFSRLNSEEVASILKVASENALAKKAAELAPQPQVVEAEAELPAEEIKTDDSVSIVIE